MGKYQILKPGGALAQPCLSPFRRPCLPLIFILRYTAVFFYFISSESRG